MMASASVCSGVTGVCIVGIGGESDYLTSVLALCARGIRPHPKNFFVLHGNA